MNRNPFQYEPEQLIESLYRSRTRVLKGTPVNGFEKRARLKREQILDATFDLMNSDRGVAAVTVNAVAESSHVSKATIFKYFTSKNRLIQEVFMRFLNTIGENNQRISQLDLPFDQMVKQMCQSEIDLLGKVTRRFYLDLMAYYTHSKDEEFTKAVEEYNQRAFNAMLDTFNKGRKEGKVSLKFSDEFLVLFFRTLMNGVSSPDIYEKLLPYVSEWTDLIVRGVAPTEAERRAMRHP